MRGFFQGPLLQVGLRRAVWPNGGNKMKKISKWTVALGVAFCLQGCTVLAIADVAASTVVYGVKTVVNVVDAVTPDIINKKKD